MKFSNVVLAGLNHLDAPIKYSSEAVEERLSSVYQRLKLPFGRLELQTGIRSRGLWPLGTRPSSMAIEAASQLLEDNNIAAHSIDLLVHASVCRDFLEPATASVVHASLGLSEHCRVFDLSNACLGMLSAMEQAACMIELGVIKKALLVSAENATPLLEKTISFLNQDQSLTRKSIKKYVANLTIGSGAVAMLLTSKEQGEGPALVSSHTLTDSKANNLCQGDGNTDSLMMQTESELLLQAGVEVAKKNWPLFLKESDWQPESVDRVICHQVGVAHRDLMLNSLEIDLKKDYSSFHDHGNTGSAALPTALNLAIKKGAILEKQNIALLGIGSGLVCTMMGLRTC